MAKDIKIVYDGGARVKRIDYTLYKDFESGLGAWTYRHLPEEDRDTAFALQITVAPDDGSDGATVELEISHRELSGRLLERYAREDGATPTQTDMAIDELARRGLAVRGADERATIQSVFDTANIGKAVEVQVYLEGDGDGGYWPTPRARFAFPRSRLPWLTPVAAKPEAKAAAVAQPSGVPAPSDDLGEMPF